MSQVTPTDFTVCAKNIPVNLDVDYRIFIKDLFENFGARDKRFVDDPITVTKVVLVYDLTELNKLE